MSRHAVQRSQSRGVSPHLVEAVMEYADIETKVGCGCVSWMISRQRLARIPNGMLTAAQRERLDGIAVVVSNDDCIVTVIHLHGSKAKRYLRRLNS